jgi:uncharacterized protein involved in outer membrane biogenesis
MKRICLICAIIPATLIIIVSALIMALKLDTVHQFAISRVNKAIPGTISLGSLKLYLLDLRAVIRDLEVADPTGRPLAGIKKIEVDVSTRSLLRRKLVVEKVLVEKPEASLELDPPDNYPCSALSQPVIPPQRKRKMRKPMAHSRL